MSKALVGNCSDEEQVKSAKQKEKFAREKELDDLKYLLSVPQGRRFIWRYLEICGVFRSIWHASALIHFNEGKRDVGLHLIGDITEADPEGLIRMMAEAKKEEKNA